MPFGGEGIILLRRLASMQSGVLTQFDRLVADSDIVHVPRCDKPLHITAEACPGKAGVVLRMTVSASDLDEGDVFAVTVPDHLGLVAPWEEDELKRLMHAVKSSELSKVARYIVCTCARDCQIDNQTKTIDLADFQCATPRHARASKIVFSLPGHRQACP